jgi:signal transduction histidine kinase
MSEVFHGEDDQGELMRVIAKAALALAAAGTLMACAASLGATTLLPLAVAAGTAIVVGISHRIRVVQVRRRAAAPGAWPQAILDQMTEGVVWCDRAGRVVRCNRAAAALARDGRADSTAAFDLRRASGEQSSAAALPVARALASDAPVPPIELVAHRNDGSCVPLAVSATPLHGADGALVGAAMILRDLSALRAIERMHGEAAALVVHDMQQPTHAIVLGLDLLLRGELGARDRATGERIRGATARLARMVGDLGDVSMLDAQKVRLHRQDVELARFVRDVVERCPEVAARVAVRAPAGPMIASCDVDRLEQVIANLLGNAAKYSDAGTAITVEIRRGDGHVTLSVTNRGMGIPADEIDRVFERYVRSHAAARSALPGTGLGLYIARRLVEAHDGRIWASSVPGELTTFHVELPLRQARPAPGASDSLGSLERAALGELADLAELHADRALEVRVGERAALLGGEERGPERSVADVAAR